MKHRRVLLPMLAVMMLALPITGHAQTSAPQTSSSWAGDSRLVFSTLHGGARHDDARSVAVDADGFIYVTGETESRDLLADPVGGKPLTSAVFKAYLTKYAPGGKAIVWRKLIGGGSNTVTHALALDTEGNPCLVGTTGARDLPLLKPIQDKQTGLNIAFVMKFNAKGELLFSSYFGGNRNEEGLAIAVDSSNSMYIVGRATSTDLPIMNALQPALGGGGQDGFVAKITADYKLAYATYLGGQAGTDNILAIAVGPDDSLFVAGDTMSPGMATPGSYIANPVSYSGFVAKLTPDGQALTYFSYVGWRGGYTNVRALAIDGQGRAYLGGDTTAKELPTTTGALQPAYGGGFRDGFLLRLNPEGSAAEMLTYLGGTVRGPVDPDETVNTLRLDSHGHLYVAGETNSADFPGHRLPSQRPVQKQHSGGQEAFLLRLDVENSQIIYSTFWGGQKRDAALALALGPGENATLVGETYSEDFPVSSATQSKLRSANDAFVAQICDPWLFAYPEVQFNWVIGGSQPAEQQVEIFSGCSQPFPVTEVVADQPWLTVIPEGSVVPLRAPLAVNAEGLAPGNYRAIVKVTVPQAYRQTLEVPVVLTVSEPPAVAQ